jgi:hypothetical protein
MTLLRNQLILCCLVLLVITGCGRQQIPAAANTATSAPKPVAAVAERTYLEGKWDYTMSNPEQSPFSGIISVQRGGAAGYTGWISVSDINYEAQTAITKAELQGENFLYAGEVKTLQGTFPFEMKGTIKGDKMEGQNKVQTQDGPVVFKVVATRR